VVTTVQFGQALEIARLAADNGMTALSLRAVRDALRGGPPLQVAKEQNNRMRYVVSSGGMMAADDGSQAVAQQVEDRLVAIVQQWKRRQFKPQDIYNVLLGAVMPEARPAEIFLYTRPLAYNVQQPRSVGRVLAQWAVLAGKADDLRRRTQERQALPLAELPSHALLGFVGLEAKDAKGCTEQLEWFNARVQKEGLQNTSELACHLAMPALHTDALSKVALAIVERAVKNLSTQQGEEPVGSLALALARFHFGKKNVAEARKQVHEYLRIVEQMNVRYGGDYGLYRRKQQLQSGALEFAKAGQLADALDLFGQAVDIPRYRWGEVSTGSLVASISRQLAALPAKGRYETLKAWTLPAATRKAVRLVGSFVPEDVPPAAFGKIERVATKDGPGVVSSPMLLIEAARELGKLDELTAAVEQAVAQKAENADALLVILQVARGQGAKVRPQLDKLMAELPKKHEPPKEGENRERKPVEWSDYLVARACITDPQLARMGGRMVQELLFQAQQTQNHQFLTHLRRDVANAAVLREGGAPLTAGQDPGLALWHPASHVSPGTYQLGAVPSWWLGHDGQLAHVTGPEQDFLYFAYPLTGTFEFSVEAYVGSWSEAVAAYNGLVFEPFWTGRGSNAVWAIGSNEQVARPNRYQRPESFNKITVQVQPGKVRYLANGHLLYEDTDPSPTSPWLALFTRRERHTLWRNLEFKGTPQIPRAVALTSGDRMEGWVAGFYNESKLPRLSLKQPVPEGQEPPPPPNPDDYDWSAVDGVLRGRRAEGLAALDPIPSRLYYHRPLCDGESVRYEFLYEPDLTVAHPTLDRLAFLLEADGVKVHWMTDGDGDWTGLKIDNAAEEPANRRGPSRLPLKPGDWNAVKLTLAGREAVLELNGVEVYRRPLEATNDRLFGFFHYKDRTAAQVRNVVLTGNWPAALTAEQLVNLTARTDGKDSPADRRSRIAVIGETFFATEPADVLRRARALPPAERYAFLLDWVVPNAEHKAFRLYADFTPTDVAPPLAPPLPNGVRLQTGGALEAPALALVAAAKELDKLDELAERVQAAKAEDDQEKRGQLALLACVRIAQERDDNAVAVLRQLQPLLAKLGPGVPRRERWPEVVAAAYGLGRPTTRGAAQALLEHIVVKQIQPMPWPQQQILGTTWMQHVRHLRGEAQLLALKDGSEPPVQDPKLTYWAPVTHVTSNSRGTCEPPAYWTLKDGGLLHYPGHARDYAYFSIPLRGEFTITCELTSFGWREAQISYGSKAVAINHERKKFDVTQFGRKIFDGIIQPPIEKIGDWYEYKLVVGKDTLTSYINGRKIHDEPSSPDRDPWLAVQVLHQLTGGVRKVKITGQPTIPDQLELSKGTDLTGWLADYYEESLQPTKAENAPGMVMYRGQQPPMESPSWEKRGEEIYGRTYTDAPGSKQESILRYHRPLLEDGTLDYEFFYVPGKALTHPALDRLALLLDPEGVKVHWLTDGKYDRTGLAPDNVSSEKANRRGPDKLPLKERDWNRVQLALAGNQVTLRLNGVVIYERALESSNQRIFGLFHYADETEVRVRNVVYRGNWPKQLPPAEAILAAPAVTARRP
jgi:hypothetical protein